MAIYYRTGQQGAGYFGKPCIDDKVVEGWAANDPEECTLILHKYIYI